MFILTLNSQSGVGLGHMWVWRVFFLWLNGTRTTHKLPRLHLHLTQCQFLHPPPPPQKVHPPPPHLPHPPGPPKHRWWPWLPWETISWLLFCQTKISRNKTLALTSILAKCWATVAWQEKHQLRHLQICSCTCCCSSCSTCTCCRHTPRRCGKLRCSHPPQPPRSRTLGKIVDRWCIKTESHSLYGFLTVNIAFTASLWQVWRSTFCSSSTLPKALLAPRPPSH